MYMFYEIFMWVFLFIATMGVLFNFRKTFQVSYYETLLERYEDELGIKLPDNYENVKLDFWMMFK